MVKIIKVWLLLRYFYRLQTSICDNNFEMSLNSKTPFIKRDHMIYLYGKDKSDLFIIRWIKRLFNHFKTPIGNGIFIELEISGLDFKNIDPKIKKSTSKVAELLRSAENFTPKLIYSEIRTDQIANKNITLVKLTVDGEDFTEPSNLLNFLLKKYEPIWLKFLIPFATLLIGLGWGDIWKFVSNTTFITLIKNML